ncbi:MAG: 4-alpha-glucanotransferase [Thermanaerothrix sp.]|nr:4-alpha-glucanotransferase [Thermanaerothrix sp.]
MFLQRKRGVLLHFTSLEGPYGAGDLGPSARRMGEIMAEGGWTLWQMLPLNYPNPAMGFSPYASYGAFPLNPALISIEDLVDQGLIGPELAGSLRVSLETPWRADLMGAFRSRRAAAEEAFRLFKGGASSHLLEDYQGFLEENSFWIHRWGLFMALKERFRGDSWTRWPLWARSFEGASAKADVELMDRGEFFKFEQFLAFRQVRASREFCSSKGVTLMGDLPIYVAHDGMDPWAFPEIFELDGEGNPVEVAGVPPDYFSETGQRWGNPLYRWDVMKEDRYQWWFMRLKTSLQVFDVVRIDHFRGFAGYWAIPSGEDTAVKGRWREGPGNGFFDAILERFGFTPRIEGRGCPLPLVAEDLGVITDDVTSLRLRYGMPGMRVLQFAFSGGEDNPHLPWNHEALGVAYTGTHDNDTSLGWWIKASSEERRALRRLAGRPLDPEGAVEAMVRLVLCSPSRWRVIPVQDLLCLDGGHRMNTPSSAAGNWLFRLHRADHRRFQAWWI